MSYAYHMYLLQSGRLYGMGSNVNGEIGNGLTSTGNTSYPAFCADNVKWASNGNGNGVILKNDGTIWGVGSNTQNQLGTSIATSTRVTDWLKLSEDTDWEKVWAGYQSIFALKKDGSLYSIGQAYANGFAVKQTAFTLLDTDVKMVDWMYTGGVYLKNNGYLYVFGGYYSSYPFKFGLSPTPTTSVPATLLATNVDRFYTMTFGGFYITKSNEVYGWGKNTAGELGLGTATDVYFPTLIPGLDGSTIKEMAGRNGTTYILKTDGTMIGAGYAAGGAARNELSFIPVPDMKDIVSITGSTGNVFAFDKNGQAYGIGTNSEGQFGLGNTTASQNIWLTIPYADIGMKVTGISHTKESLKRLMTKDGSDIKTWRAGYYSDLAQYRGAAPAGYVMSDSKGGSSLTLISRLLTNGYGGSGWTSTNPLVSDWIKLDIGTAKTFGAYTLQPFRNTYYPRDWKLEGSNDDATWTLIDQQSNITTGWKMYLPRVFKAATPGSYRYYRFTFTGAVDGYFSLGGIGFSEKYGWETLGTDTMTEAIAKSATRDFIHFDPANLYSLTSKTPEVLVWSEDTGFNDDTIYISAVPPARIVFPKGDIDLTSATNIDDFMLTATETGGVLRVIASFDSGVTWKGSTGTAFMDVDVNNLSDVKANGMSITTFNNVTGTQWNQLRGTSNTVRFAYYLEILADTDVIEVDEISMQVDIKGIFEQAVPGEDYRYSYVGNNTIQVKLFQNGDYKINYVD